MFFEKGLFRLDNDYLGPIHLQKHALNAETIPEEEVQRRYLELLGRDAAEFKEMLRYSLEDYSFLKALTEERAPFPDFHTALEAHRVVDAIYRSGESGGPEVLL